FDTADMEKLWAVPDGDKCAANQVLYHLGSRGIEYDLLPWLMERGVPVMAYCPVAQAGSLQRKLLADKGLNAIAQAHNVSVFQVMLAFVLRQEQVIAIPKAAQSAHTRENALAAELVLSEEEWTAIDRAFPAPTHKVSLDIQ
ncbi:MAG: aldo/keto reductase, partial [Christensenella sp.]|uniref:aldo/keto reductase n=1 Tax=Christensenella sp. TaxID=1935934 RepID=UPI002B20DFDD